MFSGKNSNHQQHNKQLPQSPTKPGSIYFKSNKKFNTNKRSVAKPESDKSQTDSIIDPKLLQSSTSKANTYNKIPKNYKPLQSTKVKSCSWKRSDKQISTFNSLANKKPKSLHKKSPTWLKLPNSAVKLNEKTSFTKHNEQTSVCRPGTLYSDVLFGAGSSCLVKVKNLTPRRCSNNEQKKLTKGLGKYSDNDNSVSDDSEIETETNLFPSLQKINNQISSPTQTTSTTCSVSTSKNLPSLQTLSNFETLTIGSTITSDSSPSKYYSYAEADVVILSERIDLPSLENGNSYGNYLNQHFQLSNGNTNDASTSHNMIEPNTHSMPYSIKSSGSSEKTFIDDIPKWNFINTNTSLESFPRFLGQFDDEHYLKAEKMALLGLKLALGNNSKYNNFKL